MDGRLTAIGGTGVPTHPMQCVRPDPNHQMGDTTATTLKTLAPAAVHTTAAVTKDGIVIVSIPASAVIAVRIAVSATAVATDQPYYGPNVYHFPIRNGERASFHNAGAASADIAVSLAG